MKFANHVEQGSVLGPTVRFKGELSADEDLQIHGHVEGTITHTKYLTIGEEGSVKADIRGHIIAVEGHVEGNLTAETSIAITKSGHMVGDLRSPSVSINDGADFNGKIFMEPAKTVRVNGQSEKRNGLSPPGGRNDAAGTNGEK